MRLTHVTHDSACVTPVVHAAMFHQNLLVFLSNDDTWTSPFVILVTSLQDITLTELFPTGTDLMKESSLQLLA